MFLDVPGATSFNLILDILLINTTLSRIAFLSRLLSGIILNYRISLLLFVIQIIHVELLKFHLQIILLEIMVGIVLSKFLCQLSPLSMHEVLLTCY